MKILFYEMKDFELDYILEKIPDNIEPRFFKIPLLNSTYVDQKYHDIEALSVFISSEINSSTLSRFKNLKYIFLRCAGYSNVDLKYCKKRNIKIYFCPNYGNSTVAEYVFALILSLSRKILQSKSELEQGKIERGEIMGLELEGKTMGIVGLGAIGKNVASIAQGFKMRVIAHDKIKSEGYSYLEFDEILKQSDFLVLCCPLNEETRGMIDKEAFLKMKKEAILVNVARGEIVNTKDLLSALVKKRIAGAALDVVECERALCDLWNFCQDKDLMENCLKKYLFVEQLHRLKNVIITPHNAYNTKEAIERIVDITLANIQDARLDVANKNLVLL